MEHFLRGGGQMKRALAAALAALTVLTLAGCTDDEYVYNDEARWLWTFGSVEDLTR